MGKRIRAEDEEEAKSQSQQPTSSLSTVVNDGDDDDALKKAKVEEGAPGMGGGRGKKKIRIGVLHGYRGKGYHGNTANTGSEHLPTIDLELEKAFHSAGIISDSNFGTLKHVGWNRCARTDKGVSALCNLISMKGEFTHEELDDKRPVLTRINSFLPPHIRVWSLVRVKGHFDGKNEVDGRTYEYVAPAFCFRPNDADPATWVFDEAMRQKLNAAMLYFVGTHNYHNYTKGKSFNNPESSRVITHFSVPKIIQLPTGTFLLFRIKGQSFMLHQIRKMVASIIILCSKNKLDDARRIIGGTLQNVDVSMPKAPAVGLFLRQVHFDSYGLFFLPFFLCVSHFFFSSKRYNKFWGKGEGREPVELTPDQVREADEFATKVRG